MSANSLDAPATRERLRDLARDGHLSRAALRRGLELLGHPPPIAAWRQFLDRALALVGAALTLSGVVFFFAYNWDGLPHLAKLAVVQIGVLLAVGAALGLRLERLPGQAALLAAAVLVGVLLAVYGQAYQTGADAFQLFVLWAALIAGWVAVARFIPLWLLLLALLNVALWLFVDQGAWRSSSASFGVPLFLLNGIWLLAWEYARLRGAPWMQGRTLPRLAAAAAFAALTAPTLELIFNKGVTYDRLLSLAPALLAGFWALALYIYSSHIRDLFMLTLGALCAIVVLTWAVVRLSGLDPFEGSLPLSLFVLAQGAAAVALLRRTARAWEKGA